MKLSNERGQGLVEYALLIVLIAVVVLGILMLLGPTISNAYSRVIAALSGSVIISATATNVTDAGFGQYNVTVDVEVSQTTTVTLDPGVTTATVTCNPGSTCTLSAKANSASGSFTVTDGNGKSFPGSFP